MILPLKYDSDFTRTMMSSWRDMTSYARNSLMQEWNQGQWIDGDLRLVFCFWVKHIAWWRSRTGWWWGWRHSEKNVTSERWRRGKGVVAENDEKREFEAVTVKQGNQEKLWNEKGKTKPWNTIFGNFSLFDYLINVLLQENMEDRKTPTHKCVFIALFLAQNSYILTPYLGSSQAKIFGFKK